MRASLAGVVLVLMALVVPAQGEDLDCLGCHGDPAALRSAASTLGHELEDRQLQALVVDREAYAAHVGLACLDCHSGIDRWPHPEGVVMGNPCVACHDEQAAAINSSVHRDPLGDDSFVVQCWTCHGAHDIVPVTDSASPMYPYNVSGVCLGCHEEREYLSGVHGTGVQLAGLTAAATCVSCHGAHDIQPVSAVDARTSRRQISFTCGKCHGRIAETYRSSVHGAALMSDDNPDVPTCVDCHRAHATADPRSPAFRADSPQLCAGCHSDQEMMTKYGLSTKVFETYVADFHGTTAQLFESVTPDRPLNQAVCYDCHGYHDVYPVHGVGREQIELKLLQRCRVCHPSATTRFLSAWTGHYIPSPERYPWIYYVRLFYRFAIPGIVGFFLVYIALDWRRARRHHAAGHEEDAS